MLDKNQINEILTGLLTDYFNTEFTCQPDLEERHRYFDSSEYVIVLPSTFGLASPTEQQLVDKVISWLDKSDIEAGYKYQIDRSGSCYQLHPLIDYSPQDE
ncbi:hypothetical protein HKA89_05380 [Vibrio parahaemolyticus]|uniref:hypothetical protein n=1 Tax=Vibrio parahaemolyticus TaxID=670 RepID=UPI00146D2508|nr:hypothetical protein [Vibrio parahaemolyticus]MDF5276958.1 hypothetical protein [Vibrio parahaemolyticus]NMU68200.1 hypothetical protein [Vibrio parahaemolyticus]